jgi:hypothetical protein
MNILRSLFRNKKGALEMDSLGSIIIAVIFGIIIIIGIWILKDKWSSAISYVRNLARFGG